MKNLFTSNGMRLKAFLFLSLFAIGGNVQGQVSVGTTVTWDAGNAPPAGYEAGITIGTGGHLTVDGITLNMEPNSQIVLYGSGSIELVNSAEIDGTPTHSTDKTWGGIYCDGNAPWHVEQFNQNGFPNYDVYDDIPSWEGSLNPDMPKVLLNDSKIKNAEIGVESNEGGIVRARGTTFTNCQIGVKITKYQSIFQGGMYYLINACYFMDCTFQWDDDFLFSTNLPYIGIDMSKVKGINIGGTLFKNSMTTPLCPTKRGIGIKARDAKFLVAHSGNTVIPEDNPNVDGVTCETNGYDEVPGSTCSFEQLSTGIDFATGENISFKVKNAKFKTNYRGITADGSLGTATWTMAVVFNCVFESSRTDLAVVFGDEPGGGNDCYTNAFDIIDIYLKATRTELYDNDFVFNGKRIHHVVVDACGSKPGWIRTNTFGNANSLTTAIDDVVGVYAVGTNDNVIVSCNTFSNMGTDIKINSGATLIDPMQGTDPGEEANNTFSASLLNRLRIDNTGNSNITYNVQNGVPPIEDPTPNSVNVVKQIDMDEVASCEVS